MIISTFRVSILTLFAVLIGLCARAAEKTIILHSNSLDSNRSVTIYTPDEMSAGQRYPVFYVMDGQDIGAMVNGTLNYYAAHDLAPECIVVAIDQKGTRWEDCSYDPKGGKLVGRGYDFFQFVSKELSMYVDSAYRTSGFNGLIGHSLAANYINYFLMEAPYKFSAFVAISPYYHPKNGGAICNALNSGKDIFYYLATSENDLKRHKSNIREMDGKLRKIKNPSLRYKYELLPVYTHITQVATALNDALLFVFKEYQPTYYHYTKLSDVTTGPPAYYKLTSMEKFLTNYYANIKKVYGLDLEIRMDDIENCSFLIKDKQELKNFADYVIRLQPQAYVGYYMLGSYYEKLKDYTTALENYRKGYELLGSDILNKEDFYEDVKRMEEKLAK